VSDATRRFVVEPREGGRRLDRFLQERIPGLSRNRIQSAIREQVTLSWGPRARPSTRVHAGGEVLLRTPPPDEVPLEIELPVLERGTGWLAVNKPPGIPVHPVNRVLENSLIRMLRRQEADEGLRLVHRLDRETSGAMLVAADPPASRLLSRAFMQGRVHKEYLALVGGSVTGDAGRIDLPIGEARDSRVQTRLEAGQGKPSVTGWRVERRFADRTLLRLYPSTGRRHQLRVHLASMGHPILGDLLYAHGDRHYLAMVRGEGDVRRKGAGPRRQLLHCALLRFPDPAGTGSREVHAPLPEDFAQAFVSGPGSSSSSA
jgi:23S rRNA pseudouridine1911/1915/1917 synthase